MNDLTNVRSDFPILSQKVHGHPLVYLDNGATTQLPKTVMEAVTEQYLLYQANIHRGIHYLSELSTARVEQVRKTTADCKDRLFRPQETPRFRAIYHIFLSSAVLYHIQNGCFVSIYVRTAKQYIT